LSLPSSPEFLRALLAEETRQHARVLGPSLGSTVVAAALLGVYLHGFMPPGPLLAWLGALLGAVALRGGLHLLDRQGAAADPHDPRWRQRYRLTALLLGLAWAGGGVVLAAAPGRWQVEVLVLTLVAVSALSAVTLAFDPSAALLRGLPPLLPLPWLMMSQPAAAWPRGLGVALLVLLVTAVVIRRHRQALQLTVHRQLQQAHLAEDLSRSVAASDRAAAIAGVGGWEIDADTSGLRLSPQALRLLDLPPDAAPTLPEWLALVDEEMRGDVQAAVQGALASGQAFSIEVPLRTATARMVHLRVAGEARRVGGRIVAVDGALQDVTRQHTADRALADKHEQLEQLLRTARQGFWFIDVEGRTIDLNPAMADLLGRARDDVIGRPVPALFVGAARSRLEAELAARRQGRDGRYEITVTRPDGSARRCLVNAARLFDGRGRLVGSVGIWTDLTDRLAAEAALRVHEVVINSSAELISVLDEDERYRLVNDAWCRALGLRREQVLGRFREDFMPGMVSAERRAALRRCLDERCHVMVRDQVLAPGQPPRALQTDFYPITLGDEERRLVALVSRDITQDEAQRAAMVAASGYLRATLEATGEAIYATDSEHDDEPARFANAYQLALWKLPPDMQGRLTNAVVMARMRELLADPDEVFARMGAIVAAGLPVDDLRLTLLDGRHIKLRFACVEVHGRKLRVWSGRDVTAELAAVAARETAAAEQRAMLDNFPGYIGVVDGLDRYVHVNDRLAAVMHRPPSEIVGQPIALVLGDARWRKLRQTLEQARRTGLAVTSAQYPAPDGKGQVELDVTHVAGPRQADGTQTVYAFGIDVTERRRAQAALIDALSEAERANKAKSQFLSSMSHELRTPLNAVLGFGQLLAQQPLPADQRHQVGEILRGGRHLLALINDLLDLGRIDAGELEVVCEAVDARAVIDECLGLMEPLAREHGITLEHRHRQGGALSVHADPRRLRQVLLNLLSNAIKYNQPQGMVFVEAEPVVGGVELRVHDTGPGLSEDAQQRLFRPFERLDAGRGPVDGTGIGLALSRDLVQAMGGQIGVVSATGHGSTFWFRLQPATAALPAAAEAAAAALPAAGARRRALYIEDNPVNLMLMAAMLEDELDLETETDPLRGLERAQAAPPDLVLLDIQLPGIDGYEVLRRLRADPRTQRLPVVAVSANAMRADVAAGQAAGFEAYLTKPVDLGHLLATVREVLRRAPS
jgi:PAS domain S-box-containing protein